MIFGVKVDIVENKMCASCILIGPGSNFPALANLIEAELCLSNAESAIHHRH